MEQPDMLFRKFRDNKCSKEEISYLLKLFAAGNDEKNLKKAIDDALNINPAKDIAEVAADTDAIVAEVYNKLSSQIPALRVDHIFSSDQGYVLNTEKKTYKLWQKIVAAAVILITLFTGVYFYIGYADQQSANGKFAKNDIEPGGNKAILTLSNGEVIDLAKVSNGGLARQAGISVTKSKDGQLVYTLKDSTSAEIESVAFNTVTTPRGGQYQINLPDGTRIWLNAASSIKFPASFNHLKERRIQLTGEAYFEVAKNKKLPFKVVSNQQTVEVLGTHFNINSYTEEAVTKTTLLEGLVKVNSNAVHKNKTQIICPGQQSITSLSGVFVQSADIKEVMGWQKGNFVFTNQPLKNIMYSLSRWYDVDIIYEDEALKNEIFTGVITRFGKVSKVLRILELTDHVRFRIEGRRITVTK